MLREGVNGDGSLDLGKELQVLTTVPFEPYDLEPSKTALHKASTLLYLCANSGEIAFDILFIKGLQRLYPDLHIVAAVRDKPTINDATLEDADAVGLNRLVTTITSGSIYPGTILRETTEEFQTLFASADVILPKGQGNFETQLPVMDEKVFFLLRVKCDYMAALSNVRKDNLILIQGNRN